MPPPYYKQGGGNATSLLQASGMGENLKPHGKKSRKAPYCQAKLRQLDTHSLRHLTKNSKQV